MISKFDWEQRKLGELATFQRGKSKHRPRNDKTLFGGEYPFIQTGDVANSGLFLTKYSQTYNELGLRQSKLWPKNTIVITIAGNIADSSILAINACFPDSVIGVEKTSLNILFLKFTLDNLTKDFKRKASVGTQPNLNLQKIKSENAPFPSYNEQTRIGQLLAKLDETLTLQQRKLNQLKILKKALLQKMFANEDHNKPELRLNNFNDEWEQRKFKTMIFPEKNKNTDGLKLPYYSISNKNGFIPQDEQFGKGNTYSRTDKKTNYIVSPNSFAYNPARINVGSIGYQDLDGPVLVSSLYEIFKTNSEIDDDFLKQWFKTTLFSDQVKKYQEGGVRQYYFLDKLQMSAIKVPQKLLEQKKLSAIFNKLDEIITLQQIKIHKLNLLKKFLLQTMFV